MATRLYPVDLTPREREVYDRYCTWFCAPPRTLEQEGSDAFATWPAKGYPARTRRTPLRVNLTTGA